MGNAAFHKGKTMQQALDAAGHTFLYLPPYSPDLNPIEYNQNIYDKLSWSSYISHLLKYHDEWVQSPITQKKKP